MSSLFLNKVRLNHFLMKFFSPPLVVFKGGRDGSLPFLPPFSFSFYFFLLFLVFSISQCLPSAFLICCLCFLQTTLLQLSLHLRLDVPCRRDALHLRSASLVLLHKFVEVYISNFCQCQICKPPSVRVSKF
jgi:hypothetical protein